MDSTVHPLESAVENSGQPTDRTVVNFVPVYSTLLQQDPMPCQSHRVERRPHKVSSRSLFK